MNIKEFQTVTLIGAGPLELTPFCLDEYEQLLRKVLIPSSSSTAHCPRRILSRPFLATLSGGEGINSTKWGFKILGSAQPIQRHESFSIAYSESAFDVSEITRRIEPYDLLYQSRIGADEFTERLDLCLPPHRCTMFLEILEHPKETAMREVLLEEFIQELLADIVGEQPAMAGALKMLPQDAAGLHIH